MTPNQKIHSYKMGSRRLPCSMFCTIFLLSLFFASKNTHFHCLATSVVGGNETDQLALLNFKAKIRDDPFGVMDSWNTTTHFCQWYGVICGRRHQRVTFLNLSSSKLGGSISPHVGNLSFLRVLNLRNNTFTDEIPPEIGRLHRLQELRLANNSIGGSIPSNLSKCSNLGYLDLGGNQLIGKIPDELGSLSKVYLFAAYNNKLTGGIPSSLANMSSLKWLNLPYNSLGGTIPNSLGSLTALSDFIVWGTGLSGTIPPSIFNISSLQWLMVGQNQIHGTLPTNLGTTLPNIESLDISSNQFTGSIPSSIINASKLEMLQIQENQFSGQVPPLENMPSIRILLATLNNLGSAKSGDLNFLCTLTNATNFQDLEINGNRFGGTLPECISNLSTTIQFFIIDNNMISGSIPAGISNLVNLEELDMWNNHFSGNIPPSIEKLQNLKVLQLHQNSFSGEIPSSVGNLTLLLRLSLNENSLEGKIPSSLGKCQNMLALNLSSNNLSGTIPQEVTAISSLSIFLDLSQNHLIGAIPNNIGNLKNLEELYIYDNMLSGEIPGTLGSCLKLEILKLQGNSFQGSIPQSLSSLRGLQVVDLSNNNISGQIPEFLSTSQFQMLLYLNLSFNNFEGSVPVKGVFKNASATSVDGNKKLCGGISQFHLPICDIKKPAHRRPAVKLKIVVATVAGVVAAALVLISIVLYTRFRKKDQALPSSSSGNSLVRLTYQSLHNATNGFSSANLIGVGSFGRVYRGILDEDRPSVAVKVLDLQQHKAEKGFMAECEAMKCIRHRNLVKLITACSSIDYQGNDFKALVYEFMVNGNLDEWLHPYIIAEDNREAPRCLNVIQRINISIDVASALEYLHHHCEIPVIHCDLKPSNILLDDTLTGHISDFGLAKFLLESNSKQSSSLGLRGTIGYTPPEYGLGSDVSTFGDVYSYGILLLEMFTGKRPTSSMFKEGLNLHDLAKSALPDKVMEILDPILLQETGEAEAATSYSRRPTSTIKPSTVVECLISIVEIGVACSVESPGERMNIKDVGSKLVSIRKKLVGTHHLR